MVLSENRTVLAKYRSVQLRDKSVLTENRTDLKAQTDWLQKPHGQRRRPNTVEAR